MNINKKTIGIIILSAAALLILALVVLTVVSKSNVVTSETSNVYIDHPDAEVSQMSGSKLEAYRGKGNRSAVEEYWDNIGSNESNDEDPLAEMGGAGSTQTDPLDELIEQGRKNQNKITQVNTDARPSTSAGPGSSAAPVSRTKSPNKRKTAEERMAEHQALQDSITRRYQNGEFDNGLREDQESEQQVSEEEQPKDTTVKQQIIIKRSGNFSTFGDNSFGSSSSFSSLEDETVTASELAATPIKCMFVRDEKIESGQRVAIRLLDDIIIGSEIIPRNTHIMAVCSISKRLDIKVSSMDINGKIINLNYDAYDTDGAKGIYCPNIDEQIKEDARRGGFQLGRRPISRMGNLAKDVADIGISIAETASNSHKTIVRVPSGYTFYLLPGKE